MLRWLMQKGRAVYYGHSYEPQLQSARFPYSEALRHAVYRTYPP